MVKVLYDSGAETVLYDTVAEKILASLEKCAIPEGACVHYLEFEFFLDAEEVSFGGSAGYLIEFSSYGLFPDYDGSQWWVDESCGATILIPFADTGPVEDTWHSGQFFFVSDGTDVTFHYCIDGIASDEVICGGEFIGDLVTRIDAGSHFPFGSISHRSLRNIKLVSLDPYDVDNSITVKFDFPPDTFDTTTGPGVTFPGGDVLRIDDDATSGPGSFATKEADPDEDTFNEPIALVCCCDLSPLEDITTVTLDFTLSVEHVDCDSTSCYNASISLSNTWTRTFADGDPSENEFKIFCRPGTFIEFEPGVWAPTGRRVVDFLAGSRCDQDFGTHVSNTLDICAFTAPSVTCCEQPPGCSEPDPPDCDDIQPNPDRFVWTSAQIGAFKETTPCNLVQSDCNMWGIKVDLPTAGFGCDNFTDHSKDCEDIGGTPGCDLPTEDIALEDLIGTHVYSTVITSPHGRTWNASWAVTIS